MAPVDHREEGVATFEQLGAVKPLRPGTESWPEYQPPLTTTTTAAPLAVFVGVKTSIVRRGAISPAVNHVLGAREGGRVGRRRQSDRPQQQSDGQRRQQYPSHDNLPDECTSSNRAHYPAPAPGRQPLGRGRPALHAGRVCYTLC